MPVLFIIPILVSLLASIPSVTIVKNPPPPIILSVPTVEAHEPTLQERALQIAEEYGIQATTLSHLIYSESRWNPNADNGADRGLVQINREAFPEITDEQAFDVDFSLRFAAKKIQENREFIFVACNCTFFVRAKMPSLPLIDEIQPNANRHVGAVAVFKYPNVRHVAYVKEVQKDYFVVQEANFIPCFIGERNVRYDDNALLGFWTSQ